MSASSTMLFRTIRATQSQLGGCVLELKYAALNMRGVTHCHFTTKTTKPKGKAKSNSSSNSNQGSIHNEDTTATQQSLEELKLNLLEKRLKLRELTTQLTPLSRPIDSVAITTGSIHDPASKSLPLLSHPTPQAQGENVPRQPLHQHQRKHKQGPDRHMPIFTSPADMTVRLPKVVRDFTQPNNPEIAKIALIGPPNVGKSTIVNDLVKSTVSIVSIRPHTTRERIRAVLAQENKQIIFYDTPGVVPEKNISRLNRELVTSSWRAIEDADHLLVVMDCHKLLEHSLVTEKYLFERLQKMETNIPATLIFNKMDLVKGQEEKLQKFVQEYNQKFPNFVKVIYTSAKAPVVGIHELRSHLMSLTKPGPWLYPADQKSDRSDLSRVEDSIRSVLYEILKVPYNVKQENVGWTELQDQVLRIDQSLIVERPGLKKIIVGTNGSVIRDLTLKARQAVGSALQRRVMLNLQVKVRPKKV